MNELQTQVPPPARPSPDQQPAEGEDLRPTNETLRLEPEHIPQHEDEEPVRKKRSNGNPIWILGALATVILIGLGAICFYEANKASEAETAQRHAEKRVKMAETAQQCAIIDAELASNRVARAEQATSEAKASATAEAEKAKADMASAKSEAEKAKADMASAKSEAEKAKADKASAEAEVEKIKAERTAAKTTVAGVDPEKAKEAVFEGNYKAWSEGQPELRAAAWLALQPDREKVAVRLIEDHFVNTDCFEVQKAGLDIISIAGMDRAIDIVLRYAYDPRVTVAYNACAWCKNRGYEALLKKIDGIKPTTMVVLPAKVTPAPVVAPAPSVPWVITTPPTAKSVEDQIESLQLRLDLAKADAITGSNEPRDVAMRNANIQRMQKDLAKLRSQQH